MKTEIQNILDRNFTRGDNAKALKELFDLFGVMHSLLSESKCPNCDGSGVIVSEVIRTGTKWVDDGDGNPIPEPYPEVDYSPEPCQWCYLRDSVIDK